MTSRRRSQKGLERREEIVRAAFDVLSRDGYTKTSLGQIGRAIGIESAHILYYFSTREELLEEVLRRWGSVDGFPEPGTIGLFAQWIDTVRRNLDNPGIVQLYTALAAESVDPSHVAHAFFRKRFALLEERIAAEIAQRQREGLTPASVDPRATATDLIALSDGLQVRWLTDRDFDMVGALEFGIRNAIGEISTPATH